jgi:hypothetical protein
VKSTAVSPVWPRAGDLPSQYGDLDPEDEDLRVLDSVAAHQKRDPAEHTDHEDVDEADEHDRRA